MAFPIPRRLRIFLVIPLLVWLALGLITEMDRMRRRARRPRRVHPQVWLLVSPQVDDLRRALARVDGEMPPGEALAFTSPADSRGGGYFRYRWAAYLLPGRDVIPFGDWNRDRAGGARARYLLSYGIEPAGPPAPGLEEVDRQGEAILWRIKTPPTATGEGP